jgi:hypothetical protein
MPRIPHQRDANPAARYVAERYWPGLTLDRVQSGEVELRRAAAALSREGRAVRYLGTTFIAAEEAAFAVFEASDPAWVEEVNRRAGQQFDRIVPAIDLRESERPELAPPSKSDHPAPRKRTGARSSGPQMPRRKS